MYIPDYRKEGNCENDAKCSKRCMQHTVEYQFEMPLEQYVSGKKNVLFTSIDVGIRIRGPYSSR